MKRKTSTPDLHAGALCMLILSMSAVSAASETVSDFDGNAWRSSLSFSDSAIGRLNTFPQTDGFSLRCVKNVVFDAQTVVDSLAISLSRISTYSASAEIVKRNPCNVQRSTGHYWYHQPESAMITIGIDTFTTLDSRGCSSLLEGYSILVAPVLSAEPVSRMVQAGAELRDSTGDTVELVLEFDSTTYTYCIDTKQWTVASIQNNGKAPFSADYYYDEFNGIPVLSMVAVDGDTSLAQGGYRFSSIRLNGQLDVHPASRPKKSCPVKISYHQHILNLTFSADMVGRRNLIITTLSGRVLYHCRLPRYQTEIAIDMLSHKHVISGGTYLLTIQSGSGQHTAPTTLLRQ
ncbi:MAG: hypothetical protein GF398_02560 [Chitinivibrionales bacterium]|nr:hypothetical protein [Chitinivibrionales bacterium]